MNIRFLILILTTFHLSLKADQPGTAYQYDRYSENEKYYFKSIPFLDFDMTTLGKTIVYNAKTGKVVHKIKNYLPRTSFISNNGKILVTTTYWMGGHSNLERQELIRIYFKRGKYQRYFLNDLIKDKQKLQRTISHTLWYDKIFVKDDTLNILTLDKNITRIDLKKGKIIKNINYSLIDFKKDNERTKHPKTNIYGIKYPKGYVFPDLINGEKFHKALINGLDKKEVKEYESSTYYISVSGLIDKKGKCKIYYIRASVNKDKNSEESKKWKKSVEKWITSQKYKVDLIPKNCDKWVFEEYFYLSEIE